MAQAVLKQYMLAEPWIPGHHVPLSIVYMENGQSLKANPENKISSAIEVVIKYMFSVLQTPLIEISGTTVQASKFEIFPKRSGHNREPLILQL